MAGMANERVSAPTSNIAKKMMESMGWKDGDGLGAKGDGRKSHIATKKNGADGIGYGKQERTKRRDELWWADVYGKDEKKKKKKKSKKKRKKDVVVDNDITNNSNKKQKVVDNESDSDSDIDTQLFKACGGARLGMRARGEQAGKFKRTEEADSLFLEKYGGGKQKKAVSPPPTKIILSKKEEQQPCSKKTQKKKKGKKMKKKKKLK